MMRKKTIVSKSMNIEAGWILAAIAVLAPMAGCKRSAPPNTQAPQQSVASSNSAQTGSYQELFDLKSHPEATIVHPVDPSTLTDSEKKFGIAPKRDASVEYQPDIVLMEEGDKSIRAAGTDGMTWTFDANAPHVNEFQIGKIVFATGRAVGRIASLKRQGNDVSVILAPVEITDVIRKASIASNAKIDMNNVLIYAAPDFPQASDASVEKKTSSLYSPGLRKATVVISHVSRTGKWTPMSMSKAYADGRREIFRRVGKRWLPLQATQAVFHPINNPRNDLRERLIPAAWQGAPLPGVPGVRLPKAPSLPDLKLPAAKVIDLLGGSASLVGDNSGIGVQYEVEENGLSLKATGMLDLLGLGADFYLNIGKGKIPITCGVSLTGIVGVHLHLNSHSTQEFHANLQKKIWLPLELSIGFTGPVPISLTFDQALVINTGFSAKSSILNADGEYVFKGTIGAGLKDSGWLTGELTNLSKKTDVGDSIEGVSVGINSLVLGAEVRAMAGLGQFGFTTGVYLTIRYTATMLRAPDIGLPCRQGTVETWLDSGVGYAIPQWITDAINYALSLFTDIRMDRAGSILKGPSKRLFSTITKVPAGCS